MPALNTIQEPDFELNPADDSGALEDDLIAYERHKGKFRIIVVTQVYGRDKDGDIIRDEALEEPVVRQSRTVPWAEAPRDLKLASFQYLPLLLAEVIRVIDIAIERANEVALVVTSMIAALDLIDVQNGRDDQHAASPLDPEAASAIAEATKNYKGKLTLIPQRRRGAKQAA